jgi:hypothetical protein
VRTAVDALVADLATGDAATMLRRLDSLTLDRYGTDACRAYLERVGGTFADPEVVAVDTGPWDYASAATSAYARRTW